MNANKAVLLLATLVFTCFASVAFSQPAVDPLLAKLNALPPDERHAALVKGAQTERVVEWYATLPVEHSKVLIEAFRQRYPFIEVKYTGAGGGRMVNRVVTEHRAGLNKFDVLGGTSTSHVALMKAGLIARNVTPVRKELRDGFMDAEGYRVAPFTYALVIGYNTRALSKEQRPKSYEELARTKVERSNRIGSRRLRMARGNDRYDGRGKGARFRPQASNAKPQDPAGQLFARAADDCGRVQCLDRRVTLPAGKS